MAAPLASIVIPLLRQRDEWLERAVTSALAQSVPTDVLVVISPETPESNLMRLERLSGSDETSLTVVCRTGRGFPNALNTGVGLVRTERVGFLLSDDWLEPRAVEESAAIDADIVSTGAIRHDAAGAELPHLRRALSAAAFVARMTLEERAAYLTHFLLFRTSIVKQIGGLDESLGDAPGIDDYDLVWTLLEHGASAGFTSRPLYHFTIHDGERLTMRARESQLETLARIFDKHGFHGEVRERRLQEHARWFGRPEDAVWQELRSAASRD